MKRKTLSTFIAVLTFLGSVAEAQKPATSDQSEQASFGAEATPGSALVSKPAKIPDGALQVLRTNLSRGTLHCIKAADA